MITLILSLMAILSIAMIAIMGVAIGWWLIPLFLIVLLVRSVIKSVTKLIETSKSKDIIIMSKSEFEKNYTQKPASAQAK